MARASQPKGPIPVEATLHQDKRVNIPTVDAQEFLSPDSAPLTVRYPLRDADQKITDAANDRDPSLDPQLVWRDKYKGDPTELVTEAPPIYIQEKIDPRVLVESLRQTSKAGEPEPELTLFDTFDGLDELDAIDFYRHHANWSNRMILGDSFQVMASLAEREALRGQVQMIYIDPPYGIKFGSNWQVSTRNRDVKDGKAEDAVREAEQIKAFRDTWELGIHSYLTYLRDRLIIARDLLTESGSIFVQIGDENVHLVRGLLDEVFGGENFVSQISFVTTSGFTQATALGRAGDYVLWYAKSIGALKSRTLWREAIDRQGYGWVRLPDGSFRGMTRDEKAGNVPLPKGARVYKPDNILSQGAASQPQPFVYQGKTYTSGSNSHWKANYPEGMERLVWAGRIHVARNSIQYIRYPDDFGWQAYNTQWTDTATGNFTDDKVYVVQTGSKVIERCILLATDPGDLVLDPTCGSGTTAYMAEQWGRRWITIDTSRVALALARQRLMGARYPYYLLADSRAGRLKESELAGKALPLASTSEDVRQGFVYQRMLHITLGSIANNPDIHEGMSQDEADAAIARHAEFEQLYDRPFEDNTRVRVAGPFTVESLSPHRSLAFAVTDELAGARESISAATAEESGESASFDQSILDNLAAAGIQNGRRKDRLEFSQIEPFPGLHLQAVGTPRLDDDETAPSVAIAIGPQYGTVDSHFIKEAAKEAIKINGVGILAVLAFAFDPQAVNLAGQDDEIVTADDLEFATALGERTLGKLRLLPVRMNVDLLMGEALKKTGAGNLFTVFGEPDIEVAHTDDGQIVITLRGVDVYDPTTGEVRSNDTDQIALWMIDTDYNGESFFVRHCYFTGSNDPYKKLKTALRADISVEAWETLYSTVSRPFDPPATGKIAVKVINDYGDEVMQVFEVS